jgi:hypothetical protein
MAYLDSALNLIDGECRAQSVAAGALDVGDLGLACGTEPAQAHVEPTTTASARENRTSQHTYAGFVRRS